MQTKQTQFNKLYKQISTKYTTIKYISCPAFPGEKIALTKFGLRHFLYNSSGRRRALKVSIARLRLFDRALEAIKSATTVDKERLPIIKIDGKIIHTWSITTTIRNKKICVVIRQKGNNGKKHFLSVMKKN